MEFMKLNKEGRERLRKAIDNKINEIARNRRLSFRIKMPDMASLEELLFERKVDEDGIKYKTIGFTSRNLKYIDLSNVSFEDVSFFGVSYLSEGEMIHLYGSNAEIDLSKTYEYKKYRQVQMSFADLSSLNLGAKNPAKVFRGAIVHNCDLSKNNLKLTHYDCHFSDSNLSYNDLSKLNIYPDTVFDTFTNCNLKNTGLNFKITDATSPESVRAVVDNPMYLGCYINGNKIITKEEKIKHANGLAADYEAWSKVYIEDIVERIQCHTIGKEHFKQASKEKTDDVKKKTLEYSSGRVLTPEQDHEVENFYGTL